MAPTKESLDRLKIDRSAAPAGAPLGPRLAYIVAAIAVIGMVAAFAVYLGITTVAASIIRAETGVVLQPLAWHPILAWAPAAMIGLSALAGIVPAVKAYRTNVAENLVPVS